MPPDISWAEWQPSPNKSARPRGTNIDTVVLHATGGPLDPSINWLRNPNSGVSAHYVLARDGRLFQLVDESERAWHAGVSQMPAPDKREDVNNFSIGIEIVNANTGSDPYPREQVDALVRMLKNIVSRRSVPRRNMVTHAQIALPAGRKTDPAGLDVNAVLDRVYDSGGQQPELKPPEFRKNRSLVGLHARNDHKFTETDYEIIRRARIEAIKTLSFLQDDVYARCREINPKMEFIVRLYKHMQNNVAPPQQFADEFRDVINRLHDKFDVVKFEIHNEPNHLTGLEGWGQEQHDARDFNNWYKQVFQILKERHPWALFGFPGLAVPHKDLEWLDWCRESIEMSDWLGCHVYWQTPPNNKNTYKEDFWGLRFKKYHEKYPHKLIEITEFGNSNGQSGLPLSEQERSEQYVWWYTHIQNYPYIGSAHAFISTSPDQQWVNDMFTWGDSNANRVFPVADAVGKNVPRPQVPADWDSAWSGFTPGSTMAPGDTENVPGIVANAGRRPWRKEGDSRVIIVQSWYGADGRTEIGSRKYFLLPHDMAPSDTAQMSVAITAPNQETSAFLRYDLFDIAGNQRLQAYGAKPLIHRVALGRAPEERPALRADWVNAAIPDHTTVGGTIRINVTVRNAGSRVWRSSGETKGIIHLGYHWITPDGKEVEGSTRGRLPKDVAPGETVQLKNVEVEVPQQPGQYRLRLDMVAELEAWFRQVGGQPLFADVTIQAAPLRVAWVESTIPNSVVVGESLRFSVTIRNTGSRTWRAGGEPQKGVVHLGYYWITPDGTEREISQRAVLPRNIGPGETVRLQNIDVPAPEQPGSYKLMLDMVSELEAWFRQLEGQPLIANVNVKKSEVPALSFDWVAVNVPRRMEAGATVAGSATVRNTGSETWMAKRPDGAGVVHLGYKWFDINGKRVNVAGDFRAELPRNVAPGETAVFDPVNVAVPPAPGAYGLVLDLVKEGVAWFDHPPREPGAFTVRVAEPTVEVPKKPYAVEYVANTVPATMSVGHEYTVSVTLRNTSDRAWDADDETPIHLARHWIAPDGHVANWWDDFRVRLPSDVAPGQTVNVEGIKLTAPPDAGDYTLRWDLVEENVTWFSTKGSPPLEVSVDVTTKEERPKWDAKWLSHQTPDTITAGESSRVGLRIKNTGQKAWPAGGANPVRIGYHWFDQNGDPASATEDLRTSLPQDVATDQEVAVQAALATPESAGTYTLEWDLVHEGVSWFKDLGIAPLRVQVSVEARAEPAKDWRARASHNSEQASRAIDGRMNTAWESGAPQSPGMWFEIDLREEKTLDGAAFRSPGQGYPAGYNVKVSRDGQRWTTVASKGQNWTDVVVSFDARPVRYLLIEETGQTSWGATWQIGEIEIREAPAWTATASHNKDDVSSAIDRDPQTFWSSEVSQQPGLWFQVDMGKERLIDTVMATSPGRGFPLGYRVKLSTDGTNWRTVDEKTHNWQELNAQFAPTSARYIRIEQTRQISYEAPWLITDISTREVERQWRVNASVNAGSAANAIDNDGGTVWSTGQRQDSGTWFMLDLGTTEQVKGIALPTGTQTNAYPRGLTIQTSTNGDDWKTAHQQAINDGAIDFTFDNPVTARYINVRLTQSADQPWVLSEFKVQRDGS